MIVVCKLLNLIVQRNSGQIVRFQKRSDYRSTVNNKNCENAKVKVVYVYPFVVSNGLIINH